MIRGDRWLLALIAVLVAALVAVNLLMPMSTNPMPSILEHEVRSIPPPHGWKLFDTEASNKGSSAGFEMEYAGTAPTANLIRYFKLEFARRGWKYCDARYADDESWALLEFRKSDYEGSVEFHNAEKTTELFIADDWTAIGGYACGGFNLEM